MAFGFAGAHRTGKTTLAKLVAEDLGMHFHDASVSKIMKEGGFNGVADLPMAERMDAQEFVLGRFLDNLYKAPRPMITDRTPLDMVGYMLAEVTMHNTPALEMGKRINSYVNACLEATTQYFDTIIVVGPLAHYAVDPDKPPPNPAYQRAVQFVIEGAANHVNQQMYVEWLDATDLKVRRQACCSILHDRMAQLAELSKKVLCH